MSDTASSPRGEPATRGTRFLGLLGWPVEHSLSPAMHNAAFRALGLDWVYGLLAVPPAELADAIRGLRALRFQGANVTVPHKQAVIPYLDGLTRTAQAMGAVNTIYWTFPTGTKSRIDTATTNVLKSPQLMGDNTDGRGFMADLQTHGVEVAHKTALILGAGGAARAVGYALLQAGCSVILANRSAPRAVELVSVLRQTFPQGSIRPASFPQELAACADEADLIVNATAAGMWPDVERLPWDPGVPFRPRQVVYDLVYRPRQTALLHKAAAEGAQTIGGVGMLVEQGAAAFTRWTGQAAPVDLMRATIEQQLTESDSTASR